MGFFSSIGKALGSVGDVVGTTLNGLTGATNSAKTNQRYALQSMKVQNAYEKEAAQNAHQWEIADLEKAGLNPILSSGGSGAQADTGLSAGSGQSSGIDIMTSAGNLAKTIAELPNFKKTGEQIEAETTLNTAKADEIIAGLPFVPQKIKSEIIKNHAEAQEHSAKAISEKGTLQNMIGKNGSDVITALADKIKDKPTKPKKPKPRTSEYHFWKK